MTAAGRWRTCRRRGSLTRLVACLVARRAAAGACAGAVVAVVVAGSAAAATVEVPCLELPPHAVSASAATAAARAVVTRIGNTRARLAQDATALVTAMYISRAGQNWIVPAPVAVFRQPATWLTVASM